MRIKATPIIASALKPGDLFSAYGAEWWDNIDAIGSIGERVYIRTNTPADRAGDASTLVFKITIEEA